MPFYLERLCAVAVDDPAGDGVDWLFETGQITVDSASFGALAVGIAMDALGADKVVLGTDMPIFDASRALEGLRRARDRPTL